MDEILENVDKALQIAEHAGTLGGKFGSFLVSHGITPIPEWSKRNMIENQQFAHYANQLKAAQGNLEKLSNLEFEGIEKILMSALFQQPAQDVTAQINVLKKVIADARETYKAQEMASYYALQDILQKDKDALGPKEEPGATWTKRYFDYVGSVREEDVLRIWGKILAGEFCKPGSFSLKTLETLHSLDREYAETFYKLGKYVVNIDFLPEEAASIEGISYKKLLYLENIGLLMGPTTLSLPLFAISNDFYVIQGPSCSLREIMASKSNKFSFGGWTLSVAGKELHSIMELTKEDYRQGIERIQEKYKEKFSLDLLVKEIE